MSNEPVLAGLAEPTGRFLDNLLQDAVNGMAILDLDGRFRALNPAMCRMLGRDEEAVIGLRPADMTHPDDRPTSVETMELLMSGRLLTDQVQKRYLRPDGSVTPVLRTTTVLRDAGGEPIGLFTQAVDMTEVTRAQEAVERSEARFRALVAHAWDVTILLDRDGTIVYASPAAVRMLGYCPEDQQGRSAFEFLHPDDVPKAMESFARHVGSDASDGPIEYRVRNRDGEWRDAEVVVTNLFDDDSVGALVLNLRDVTEERQAQEQLASSERRFRALVGNSWDMITLHDEDGRCLFCSPAVTTQLGYTPDELLGSNPFELIHPDDVAASLDKWREARGRPDGVLAHYRYPHRDGTWRRMESTVQDRLDDPAIRGIVVNTRDVTARHRRAAQQVAIATLSSSALRGGPVETLFVRAVGLVAEAVEAEYCALLHEAAAGLVQGVVHRAPGGAGPGDAGPAGRDAEGVHLAMEVAARALRDEATEVWGGEDGSDAAGGNGVATVISPSTGPRSALTVAGPSAGAFSAEDVSFLESVANVLAAAITRDRIEHELREQALHDNLTGLPNRVLLQDRMATATSRLARRGGSVAVLFVDLDNFKLINDSLGHPVGDLVVARVASRISAVTRPADTVARFGGDEFVVLCEDADATAAAELAERIRQSIAAPIELEGRAVAITASVGIAVTSDPATTADDLLSMADIAMYAAKDSGKDCAAPFAAHMRRQATERLDALSGIRRGLANGEFRLHYQPIVNLDSGRFAGCEALVRWEHPTQGLLGPGHFIDYAEATGLIVPLGEWVMRTACAQSAEWRRQGHTGMMSINVSAIQVTQSDIVTIVAEALQESGAVPGDIHLELTENAFMSDLPRATEAMHGLHALGVRIGMDDFGTGHSSLSQLAELPVDYVKIDRSFVQRFDQDRRVGALLETIATLCRALELPAVAEGVETREQLDHLRGLGVPYIQGFLFGRPVPAGEFERLVSSRPAA